MEGYVHTLVEGSESLLGDPVGCFPEDCTPVSIEGWTDFGMTESNIPS